MKPVPAWMGWLWCLWGRCGHSEWWACGGVSCPNQVFSASRRSMTLKCSHRFASRVLSPSFYINIWLNKIHTSCLSSLVPASKCSFLKKWIYIVKLIWWLLLLHSRSVCFVSYVQSIVYQALCIETDEKRSVFLKTFLIFQPGEGVRSVKRRRIANIF